MKIEFEVKKVIAPYGGSPCYACCCSNYAAHSNMGNSI